MRAHTLRREQVVQAPIDDVFAFFSVARNLELLTPAWLRFTVITPEPIVMRAGTLIDYRLRLHGAPLRWRSLIDVWEPGRAFVDVQLHGPYALWHHRHDFAPAGPCGEWTQVTDTVHYRLPLGPVSVPALPLVKLNLRQIFDHRRRVVERRAAAGELAAGAERATAGERAADGEHATAGAQRHSARPSSGDSERA